MFDSVPRSFIHLFSIELFKQWQFIQKIVKFSSYIHSPAQRDLTHDNWCQLQEDGTQLKTSWKTISPHGLPAPPPLGISGSWKIIINRFWPTPTHPPVTGQESSIDTEVEEVVIIYQRAQYKQFFNKIINRCRPVKLHYVGITQPAADMYSISDVRQCSMWTLQDSEVF